MPNAPIFTNKYVQVEHFKPDASNSSKEGYVQDASLQAVAINLQPASMEVTALNGGAYGKGYTVFTLSSGILETDRVTLVSGTDNRQFIIKGKQNFDYGMGQHLEYYLEEIL